MPSNNGYITDRTKAINKQIAYIDVIITLYT